MPESMRTHVRNCMAVGGAGGDCRCGSFGRENRIIAKFGLKHLPTMTWRDSPTCLKLRIWAREKRFKVKTSVSNSDLASMPWGGLDAPVGGRIVETDSQGKAKQLAEVIDTYNRQRQTLERKMVEEARRKWKPAAGKTPRESSSGKRNGAPGGRDRRQSPGRSIWTPALVLGSPRRTGQGATLAIGSGRTVPPVHLKKILDIARTSWRAAGGHAGAVGLKIPWEKLELLRERFSQAIVDQLAKSANTHFETGIGGSPVGLGVNLVRTLDTLEPFRNAATHARSIWPRSSRLRESLGGRKGWKHHSG